jgi:uncharacterized membrane protein
MLGPFVGTLAAMGVLDAVYLTLRLTYHQNLFQSVQGSPLTVRILPAAVVYLLLAFAIVYVAVLPARSMNEAIMRGALTGGVMYGFYDATNYATLSRWTLGMALTDTLWGTLCGAAGAAAGYYIKGL